MSLEREDEEIDCEKRFIVMIVCHVRMSPCCSIWKVDLPILAYLKLLCWSGGGGWWSTFDNMCVVT